MMENDSSVSQPTGIFVHTYLLSSVPLNNCNVHSFVQIPTILKYLQKLLCFNQNRAYNYASGQNKEGLFNWQQPGIVFFVVVVVTSSTDNGVSLIIFLTPLSIGSAAATIFFTHQWSCVILVKYWNSPRSINTCLAKKITYASSANCLNKIITGISEWLPITLMSVISVCRMVY